MSLSEKKPKLSAQLSIRRKPVKMKKRDPIPRLSGKLDVGHHAHQVGTLRPTLRDTTPTFSSKLYSSVNFPNDCQYFEIG